MRRWWATAYGMTYLMAGLVGCDDPLADAPPVVVAPMADGAVDGAAPDVGPDAEPDAAADAGPTFDDWPAPSADGVPTRVEVPVWMRAMPPLPDDPLELPYERGEIAWPDPGEAADGVRWFALGADEDGTIGDFGFTDGYAVGRVPVPAGHGVLITADRAVRVFTERSLQPGDLYGRGSSLMPLVPEPGAESLVVAVEAFPRRGAPRLRAYTTPDQIVLNPADMTIPDLRVGDGAQHWLGIPVIETRGWTVGRVEARVVESEHWQPSAVEHAGLPPGATTQIGFRLVPKQPWAAPDVEIPITLEVASPDLEHSYRRTVSLTTRPAAGPYRQTFVSPIDGSVQYYGVNPPPEVDPDGTYGLVLSLHGAGVEAIGQARAYAAKDWAYIVAPTNRRPFGFDWEEWGRFNGLATLDDAQARFGTDPTQTWLTGHSMGGHGTWHLGVTTPGRFALLGPSAGWASFETYQGRRLPGGVFGRARAHSGTLDYISNLARRAVYIVHGDADDNVPVREGRDMFAAVGAVTDDIAYHEQPGAGHWWSAGVGEGTDCVDWPPMFELMRERRLDPYELDFDFRSPNPGYSPRHSFVTLHSALDPLADVRVIAESEGDVVRLTTRNVGGMVIDGAALAERGVETLEIDGVPGPVVAEAIEWGAVGGKNPEQHGPFNQAFRRPFCFVRPVGADGREAAWRRVAGYWASYWQIIGNGHACGLPEDRAEEAADAGYNLIRLGAAANTILPLDGVPIEADSGGITLDGTHFAGASLIMVHPERDRLGAVLTAAEGEEYLLGRLVPFSSGGGLPDYLIYHAQGGRAAGFFDHTWRWDPAFEEP